MSSSRIFQFYENDTSIHYTARLLLTSKLRKREESNDMNDNYTISSWDDLQSPSHSKFVEILSNFFEFEKVEEIQKIKGKNVTNYELRIVWKLLMIQLNVTVNALGVATF